MIEAISWSSGAEGIVLESTAKNERGDGRELDQDVDSGARGILEWITDSVTGNCGLMALSLLLHHNKFLGLGISGLLGCVGSSLNVFLGIIPSTTSVREGEGNLYTRDNTSSEESTDRIGSEEETEEKR